MRTRPESGRGRELRDSYAQNSRLDALLAELDGGERLRTPLVGTELVIRGSTAPPRPLVP